MCQGFVLFCLFVCLFVFGGGGGAELWKIWVGGNPLKLIIKAYVNMPFANIVNLREVNKSKRNKYIKMGSMLKQNSGTYNSK